MSEEGDNIIDAVQNEAGSGGGFDPSKFKMPSMDELLKLIENMEMSDEDREQLKADIKAGGAGLGGVPKGFGGGFGGGMPRAQPQRFVPTGNDIVVFIVLLLILVTIFAFFGYKLYKNLTDKERRREEKAKAKAAKKKK